MRSGSTVLLERQTCVQSYQWSYFRPLGRLQAVVDELEDYNCDEIAIIRPVRTNDTLEEFSNDLKVLRSLKSMTPISFGGGIRTIKQLELIDGIPIERLIFSSAFLSKDENLINQATRHFGRQSIQCLLPVLMTANEAKVFDCSSGRCIPLESMDYSFINTYANEIIIYDCNHEGYKNAFDFNIVEQIGIDNSRLILSGGIGPETIKTADEKGVASVLIDNKTLHREYSVAGYRHAAKL